MRYLLFALLCLCSVTAVAGTISSGGIIVDTNGGIEKVNGAVRAKIGSGLAFDGSGKMVTVASPLVQGGTFFVEPGQLTATIPLAAPISTTYAVGVALASPVTIITVGITRTDNFDVNLEWNGSGATGHWIAVKYCKG